MEFWETIEECVIKDGRSSNLHVNKNMMIYGYKRSRFHDLGPRSFIVITSNIFFFKTTGHLGEKFDM